MEIYSAPAQRMRRCAPGVRIEEARVRFSVTAPPCRRACYQNIGNKGVRRRMERRDRHKSTQTGSSKGRVYAPTHPAPNKDKPAPPRARKGGPAAKQEASGRRQAADDSRQAQQPEPERVYSGIHRFEAPEEKFRQRRNPEPEKKKREPLEKKTKIMLAIVAVLLAGALLSGYFVFLLQDIIVEGVVRYPAETIVELSGFKAGRHMLLNDLHAAKENIETDPYLEVLGITREYPRTIHIQLHERQEAAIILGQNSNAIVDVSGHVLAIGGVNDAALIHVLGMTQHSFQINQPIGGADDVQAQSLKTILTALDALALLSDIAQINLSNPLRVTMETTDGITVRLGQVEEIVEKLEWMRDVLPSLRESGITGGMLDVSAKGGPVFSYPETGRDTLPGDDGDDMPPLPDDETIPSDEEPAQDDAENDTADDNTQDDTGDDGVAPDAPSG